MEQTDLLGSSLKRGVNRRKFLRGMAATAGLGLGAGILAACGDNTPTTAPAATLPPTTASTTVAASTTVVATSAAPTTAVPTTAVPTTAVPTTAATSAAVTTATTTTVAPTTTAPTEAAKTTAAATTAASSAAPAGYIQVGKLSAAAVAPVAFSAGEIKGYVFAKSPTEVYAYSNICTHQGCEVPAFRAAQKMFMCPCHGSEYNAMGEVIQGPAKSRLPLFDNKVIGDIIYAKLS